MIRLAGYTLGTTFKRTLPREFVIVKDAIETIMDSSDIGSDRSRVTRGYSDFGLGAPRPLHPQAGW